MDSQPRSRRPYRSLVPHVFALAVFGMVAYSGVWSVATEVGLLAVPWLMAGVGGTLGALGLLIIAYLRRDNAHAQVSHRVTRAVRSLRIFMVAVAAAVAVTGVMLAPTGMDRGFAITINIGLAVALALFAAWAPDADAVHTTARPTRRT
jgi:hypothetical protein